MPYLNVNVIEKSLPPSNPINEWKKMFRPRSNRTQLTLNKSIGFGITSSSLLKYLSTGVEVLNRPHINPS